jgi:hypothetical protein
MMCEQMSTRSIAKDKEEKVGDGGSKFESPDLSWYRSKQGDVPWLMSRAGVCQTIAMAWKV